MTNAAELMNAIEELLKAVETEQLKSKEVHSGPISEFKGGYNYTGWDIKSDDGTGKPTAKK